MTSDACDERVVSKSIDTVLAVAKQHRVGAVDAHVGACCCQDGSGRPCGEGACNILTPCRRHGCNGSGPRACTPTTVEGPAATLAILEAYPPGEGASISVSMRTPGLLP